MRHTTYLFAFLIAGLYLLPASAGTMTAHPDGSFTWIAPAYTFTLAADGSWRSFTINNVELLADHQPPGYLPQPALKQQYYYRLAATIDTRTLSYEFYDDRFTINLSDTDQRGPLHIHQSLADHFSVVVLGLPDGPSCDLPPDHHLNHNHGARFVSSRNVAFETRHRTTVAPRSRDIGTYIMPGGQHLTFIPLTSVDPIDLIRLDFSSFPENHFFPTGPLNLTTIVHNRSDQSLELALVTTLETYVPNYPNEILQTSASPLTLPPAGSTSVTASFDPLPPGPYEFHVALRRTPAAADNLQSVPGTLMVAPEQWHLPDYEPDDFDAFWARTLRRLRSQPLDMTLEPITDTHGVPPGFQYVSFNGLDNRRIRGLIGLPENLQPHQQVPARLSLPGAGYGAAPPDIHALRRGEVALALSIHDMPFGGESARHHPKQYWFDTPYQSLGLADKNTFYYTHAYAAAVRAVDLLRSLPMVDPCQIHVAGGSQGGSLTMACAALTPNLASAHAGVPGRIRWDLLSWRYKANCSFDPPPGMTPQQMFHDVLAYLDIAYLARRIRCPFTMDAHLHDQVNPGPLQIYGFLQLPPDTPKTLIVDPWAGH